MGFTNVVWASRSTEQLARDLTDGPGPASVGGAGAAWVRVANEFASVSADFDKLLARLRTVWDSQASTAAAQRLEEFGKWLQAVSLSAAANGQRAEEAAVANTVAVLAMPSVSEAIETKAAQDMMASLAAYNGAVLTGSFAEFDEAATADQANAAAVMTQYEEAVAHLAQPWEQPPPPEVSKGNALPAEQNGRGESAGGGGSAGGGARRRRRARDAAGADAGQRSPIHRRSEEPAEDRTLPRSGGSAAARGMGGAPYAPMRGRWAAVTRTVTMNRPSPPQRSTAPANLARGCRTRGSRGCRPPRRTTRRSWCPASAGGPTPRCSTNLPYPKNPLPEGFAEEPDRTLEQVDDRWVSPPVIGVDRELNL